MVEVFFFYKNGFNIKENNDIQNSLTIACKLIRDFLIHKNRTKAKIRGLFFLSQLDRYEITCTSFHKKCPQNPYFLQKFNFSILTQKL